MCTAVEGEELFFLGAVEHEAVVIVAFDVGGEFDVGDEEVIEFVLDSKPVTCSSLVLNQSLALPSRTGIITNQYNTQQIK